MTRLEYQLSEAERLQERGSRLSRLLARARVSIPSPATALGIATAVILLIAVVVGAVVLTRGGGEESVVVGHRPAEVARTWLSPDAKITCIQACDVAGPYMALASGFGAAWIGGVEHGDVVRLNADTQQVEARIPVGKLPTGVVTTADAVWLVVSPNDASSSLVRIDPARNRVTDRYPVPRVSVVPQLMGDDRALWVLGQEEGVRVDPRSGAVAGRVKWRFGDGVYARAFGLAGDDLWARAEDGRMLRFDAHTGDRTGQATSPPGAANVAVIPDTGVVVGNEDGTLTRIDASNDRTLWTTRPAEGSPISPGSGRAGRPIVIVGGTVWALSVNSRRATERLTAVDLADGRKLASAGSEDFGADWLEPIGGDLWYIAPEGYAVVMRP